MHALMCGHGGGAWARSPQNSWEPCVCCAGMRPLLQVLAGRWADKPVAHIMESAAQGQPAQAGVQPAAGAGGWDTEDDDVASWASDVPEAGSEQQGQQAEAAAPEAAEQARVAHEREVQPLPAAAVVPHSLEPAEAVPVTVQQGAQQDLGADPADLAGHLVSGVTEVTDGAARAARSRNAARLVQRAGASMKQAWEASLAQVCLLSPGCPPAGWCSACLLPSHTCMARAAAVWQLALQGGPRCRGPSAGRAACFSADAVGAP